MSEEQKLPEQMLPASVISHSKMMKAAECGEAYRNHYVLRLRPRAQSAALLFGSAIDAALTAMLSKSPKDPYETFEYWWNFQELNKVLTPLVKCTDIVYAESDFDIDLLEAEDFEKLKTGYALTDVPAEIKALYDEKDVMGFHNLPEERKVLLNHANWLCLRRKGHLIIEGVINEVLPNIEEVLGTQVQVDLENDTGDKIIGFADLVARWKGIAQPVILDWKTSARKYDKDAVIVSPQLSLYTFALGPIYETQMAGFIVLRKAIAKTKTKICSKCNYDGTGKKHKDCDQEVDGERCHGAWTETVKKKALIDIMIDRIPERAQSIVLENMTVVNKFIKTGEFHRNLNACKKNWGLCPYFNRCWKDNSADLIQLEEPKNEAIPLKAKRG